MLVCYGSTIGREHTSIFRYHNNRIYAILTLDNINDCAYFQINKKPMVCIHVDDDVIHNSNIVFSLLMYACDKISLESDFANLLTNLVNKIIS